MPTGVLLALVAAGCHRPNPAYRPDAGGLGGGAGAGGADGAAGAGGASDGGADATQPACTTAADCKGNVPCGAWQCLAGTCAVVCPGCTDADHDGYGIGSGCAGLDCDDNDPTFFPGASQSCYTGPTQASDTRNVGSCRDGTWSCLADGTHTACAGQVLPSGVSCDGTDNDCDGVPDSAGTITCGLGACATTVPACANGAPAVCRPLATTATVDDCSNIGVDDDCDGAVDEDCATSCVRVSQSGDDASADGSAARPFRTIQAAINFAVTATAKNVCVAGGPTCQDAATYQSSDGTGLTMSAGVSVYGNYESTTWTRCPFGTSVLPALTVTIQPRVSTGVEFQAPAIATSARTILDGVRITRFDGGGASPAPTAVTVHGAKQVLVSNVLVTDAPNGARTYGVDISGGAEVTVARSEITAGAGTLEAIAVRSLASTPTLLENCGTFDSASGSCAMLICGNGLGLHGRPLSGPAGTTSVAVWLQSSPGAIVERNSICGGSAATNTGVLITDASAGTVVRGNGILSTGATNIGTGVALGDCMGAWPWIVGNQYIFSAPAISGGQSAGVSAATGNCHPVVEGNGQIVVGGDSSPGAAVGVVCGASSTTPSACVVIGNRFIGASAATVPSAAVTGIACQAGACARLARNVITVSGGGDTVGISIAGGGPLVDRNDVTGGCGASSTIGVFTDDAHARVQNNVIRGAACGNRPSPPQVDAFHAHVAAPQAGAPANEVDVHSNTMDAGGAGSCTGAAASLGLTTGATPPSALGIFRNNILRAGGCQTQRYGFWEDTSGLAARVFENNDLDPTGPAGGSTLYRDNSGAALSLSMVNGRAGAGGNISVDPLFAGAPADFHLGAGSACINTGTATGAPAADFDGKPRDAQPDIGAFEK